MSMALFPILNQFEHCLTGQEGFSAFWMQFFIRSMVEYMTFVFFTLITILPMFYGEIYHESWLIRTEALEPHCPHCLHAGDPGKLVVFLEA